MPKTRLVQGSSWAISGNLQRWQHARENLQPQVLLVPQVVCSTLYDPNLVVHTLDESERDLVLWLALGGDPIPMSTDRRRELLVGFESRPLQARQPVLEEAPRQALTLVVGELAEGPLSRYGVCNRLLAASSVLRDSRPGRVRFSRGESRLYVWPLDVAASLAAKP
jgi:hypothetical protein